jgi:hypothetical protein
MGNLEAMNGRAREQSESGANGARRYWPVAVGLTFLVFLVLAAAFLLDRRFRPSVATQPLPIVEPASRGGTAVAQAPATNAAITLPWARVGVTPLEREIEDAYARYWQVRTEAHLTLNPGKLPEVMADAELLREERQLANLAGRGRLGRIDVRHTVSLHEVSTNSALIYDEYLNNSVLLDAVSGTEIPTNDPPSVEKVSYVLRKVDGQWKVVDGFIHD